MIIREALEVDGDERDRHLDSQRDMLLYALALLIGDEPERPQEDVIMKALQDVAIFRV